MDESLWEIFFGNFTDFLECNLRNVGMNLRRFENIRIQGFWEKFVYWTECDNRCKSTKLFPYKFISAYLVKLVVSHTFS